MLYAFACNTFITMNIEFLEQTCTRLPGVTTDVKWGNDLVFSVAEKMFCVCSMDPPFKASFKVPDGEFEEISVRDGFQPAPYMARAKWVLVTIPSKLNRQEWEGYINQSYELVKNKLSKKLQETLGKAHLSAGAPSERRPGRAGLAKAEGTLARHSVGGGGRHKAQESSRAKAPMSTIAKPKPKVKSARVKSKKSK